MYNKLVSEFIDAQTAAWRSYCALARLEDQTLGMTMRCPRAIRVPTTTDTVAELRRVYTALVDRIIEKTQRNYATAAAVPAVSRASICALAGLDIERSLRECVVPDFDQLAELLDTQLRRVTDKGDAQ
jgi:hypothetical protein